MHTQTWRDIRTRHASGEAIKAIARGMGISRNTVRRALQSDAPPAHRQRSARSSALDDYEQAIADVLAAEVTLPATEIARRIEWPYSMTALKSRVRVLRDREAGDSVSAEDARRELTSFVGRDEEIATIAQAIHRDRLITLAGPGGVGKSRLALRASAACAEAFPDGVRSVELAALHDPRLVAQALVDGLGISDGATGMGSSLQAAVEHLRHRAVLLVLDNCEHLLDTLADVLHPLLRAAPRTCVLVTTRQPVGIAGEHVIPVHPLAVPCSTPTTVQEALTYPAVALFTDRATWALPGFDLDSTTLPDVVQVCRRLDGAPLAIELATARLRVLSVRQLLTRLTDRFVTLTEGDRAGPARHRTLLATVAWSHELCTATEQTLWSHATVFPDSFDLESLETVCAHAPELPEGVARNELLDAVSGLTSKSILIRDDDTGEVRFRMLETIREFGRHRLDTEQARILRDRHLGRRLAVHDALANGWYGPDQADWARRASTEHADLRAALDHALRQSADPTAALRLVGSPWFQWAVILSLTEHRHWLHRALDAAPEPTTERARALGTAALVASLQGDHPAAITLAEECSAAAARANAPECEAFGIHVAGLVAYFSDDFPTAARRFADAAQQYHNIGSAPDLIAALDVHTGLLEISRGNFDVAECHLRRTYDHSTAAGETWFRSYAADGLGFIALLRNDAPTARRFARQSLELIARFDDTIGLSLALDLAAWTAAADGQHERSAVLLGAASTRWGSFGQQLYGSTDWQTRRQSYEEHARHALGTTTFETAFRHGGSMSRTDVLSYALGTSEEPIIHIHVILTAREQEIVELVADGLTNRAIASILILSPRTVEGHVSRILTKLGFSRRTQLASWLERSRAQGRAQR